LNTPKDTLGETMLEYTRPVFGLWLLLSDLKLLVLSIFPRRKTRDIVFDSQSIRPFVSV